MVTAGVYLLMRSSPLIEYSSTVLIICLWLGAITTVFSSLIGLFQQDIKKVIAYSTMSQLARKYTSHSSIFKHQTICVEAIGKNTIAYSQITKARDYINNHYNFKFLNSSTIIRLQLYIICGLKRWRFDVINKLVGISEAIRLILVFIKLKIINLIAKPPIFKKHSLKKTPFSSFIKKNYMYSLTFSRSMSTSINTNSLEKKITDSEDLSFRQLLAGLIDGDGYFLLSKNGYNSCEITMDTRDKKVLYLIQHKYGGSVKQISNGYAFKYKLRNRTGLIELI